MSSTIDSHYLLELCRFQSFTILYLRSTLEDLWPTEDDGKKECGQKELDELLLILILSTLSFRTRVSIWPNCVRRQTDRRLPMTAWPAADWLTNWQWIGAKSDEPAVTRAFRLTDAWSSVGRQDSSVEAERRGSVITTRSVGRLDWSRRSRWEVTTNGDTDSVATATPLRC